MQLDVLTLSIYIGEDKIPLISTYKYLGCVVDEFLDCSIVWWSIG